MSGVREPLTRLLGLMEEYGATKCDFLNDPRTRACYTELTAIVDAHPPREPEQADAPGLVTYVDAETATQWKVLATDEPGRPGRCRSCRAPIMWVNRLLKQDAGKPDAKPRAHPLNPDGDSHFRTCTDPKRWSGKNR